MTRVVRSVLFLAALASSACTRYSNDDTSELRMPSRESFSAVEIILEPHCGSLDCHGSPARNFRVYGVYGLRANGRDVTGGTDTTEEDVDATYHSVVSVDPEALSAVYAAGGADPARWLVLRKARGILDHIGGTPLPAQSVGDRCLVAWLSGAKDQSICFTDVFGPPAPRK